MPATIALIDWNWMGHHPTYFTHFAAAMAEVGAEVVPFCADPNNFLERVGRASLPSVVRQRIAEPERIAGPQPSRFRPARWRGHYDALRFFGGLRRQLRSWEERHRGKINLVFFACIYDWDFSGFRSVERLFRYHWSGLYLHARSLRMPGSPSPHYNLIPEPEKLFRSPNLRSLGMLDEGCVESMQTIAGDRPVVVFPDITSCETSEVDAAKASLGMKLAAYAEGRKVVSLSGHLIPTKGFEEFTELATLPDFKDVVFFLGGDVGWGRIPEEKRQWLRRVWESAPNIMTQFQPLSESAMNSVIRASDVVYAAYKDFPNSSNVLTKAAMLRRPVLVSAGHLMAERVVEHHLGETAPEGDVPQLANALSRMLAPDYMRKLESCARWSEYANAHSYERLVEAFRRILQS